MATSWARATDFRSHLASPYSGDLYRDLKKTLSKIASVPNWLMSQDSKNMTFWLSFLWDRLKDTDFFLSVLNKIHCDIFALE